MSFRAATLYIELQTRRRLKLIARAQGPNVAPGAVQSVTVDEMADRMLNEAIAEKYPQLLAREAELNQLEAEIVESLRPQAL